MPDDSGYSKQKSRPQWITGRWLQLDSFMRTEAQIGSNKPGNTREVRSGTYAEAVEKSRFKPGRCRWRTLVARTSRVNNWNRNRATGNRTITGTL